MYIRLTNVDHYDQLLCEWGPIMTKYDFLEDGPVIWSYVWTDLNLT